MNYGISIFSGHNRSEAMVVAAALGGAVTGSLLLLLTNGDLAIAIAFLGAATVVGLTIYRIEFGLYILVGTVLLVDQYEIPGFSPITIRLPYFHNLKEIPYLQNAQAAVINPLEMHIFFLLIVWTVMVCLKRNMMVRGVPVWGGVALFFLALAGALAYGLSRGGQFLPALWEVRALGYFGILLFLTPQIITSRKQVYRLMWVCIAAISVKAFQGVERFISLGWSFGGWSALTNHEDSIFISSMLFFFVALVVLKAEVSQRTWLGFLSAMLLLGFITAQRRAAYAALIPSLVVFFILLPGMARLTFLRFCAPVILLLILYTAIFWQSESGIAGPIRLLKTSLTLDKETAGERYYSNLYREYEKFDLAATVQSAPLVGIGFGNTYLQPVKLVPIPFTLRDYIPHNEVIWIMVKMGAVGFFLFCLMMNGFVMRAASVFRSLSDPYLRAVCILIPVAIVAQIVVSYYDLQLTYYRNMVFLGTLVGLLPVLSELGKQKESATARSVNLRSREALPLLNARTVSMTRYQEYNREV